MLAPLHSLPHVVRAKPQQMMQHIVAVLEHMLRGGCVLFLWLPRQPEVGKHCFFSDCSVSPHDLPTFLWIRARTRPHLKASQGMNPMLYHLLLGSNTRFSRRRVLCVCAALSRRIVCRSWDII